MDTMLNLEDVDDRQTRQKIKAIQHILPGASTMLCRSALQESKGIADDACFILSEVHIDLSHQGDSVSKREDRQGNIFELSSLPSYDLDHNLAAPRKSSTSSGLTSSPSNKRDGFGDVVGYPMTDDATVRTSSMIHGYLSPSEEPSRDFSWVVESGSHPFYRNEQSAEDKQRLAFIAAAVIKAACVIEPKQSFTSKGTEAWIVPFQDAQNRPFKTFAASRGPFAKLQGVKPVNNETYIGTNRGHFIPSSWINSKNPNNRGLLHAINLQGQYKNFSFEELRLGDYLRQRTKAPHLFSLFSKLPAELRLMIWRFSLTSRVVELRYNTSFTSCWTPCATPTLLHVCKESRAEALTLYQLSFGLPESTPNIYFSVALDTLFLTFERDESTDWDTFDDVVHIINRLEAFNQKDLRKVQNLAIDEDLWDIWNAVLQDRMLEYLQAADDDDNRPVLECLPSFTGLKSLFIVRNEVLGFWKQRSRIEDGFHEESFMTEFVEFLPLSPLEFKDSEHRRCDCTLRGLKTEIPNWSMPTLGFLVKTKRDKD